MRGGDKVERKLVNLLFPPDIDRRKSNRLKGQLKPRILRSYLSVIEGKPFELIPRNILYFIFIEQNKIIGFNFSIHLNPPPQKIANIAINKINPTLHRLNIPKDRYTSYITLSLFIKFDK